MKLQRAIHLWISLVAGIFAVVATISLARAHRDFQEDTSIGGGDIREELQEVDYSILRRSGWRTASIQGEDVLADTRPPGTFDVVLYGEDFEWEGPWQMSGLWHKVVGYLDYGAPYSRTHSMLSSMWYGQDSTGDYDTGEQNSGSITMTRPISIPASAITVTLSFWSWEETELTGGDSSDYKCNPPPYTCNWDKRELYISGTVSNTWELLWSTVETPTIEGEWHQVVADISAYQGQEVRIRFTFDSEDENFNANEGWYLDDIAIIMSGVIIPGYDLSDMWVQSFSEDYPGSTYDWEIFVDRNNAAGVTTWQITDDGEEQTSVAVAAHPLGDVPIVWAHSYTNTNGLRVSDVEYMALRPDGKTSVDLTKVTDNSGLSAVPVDELGPAVAVNPVDESTVIAWTHCLSCPVSIRTRVYDVQFAIYGSSGELVRGPVALSTNSNNQVRDNYPAVETFPDGNVLIAWQHWDYEASFFGVYFTLLNRSGEVIIDIDNFTTGLDYTRSVRVARLADGNMLVVWQEGRFKYDIYYAVVDSSGGLKKERTKLTNYSEGGKQGWYPEAVGFTHPNSLIAWTEFDPISGIAQMKYAVLGGSYNPIGPALVLPNAYNAFSNAYVSMVVDREDAAVLVWGDMRYPRFILYYARLDHSGNILTSPTIHRQARSTAIYTSMYGYGVGGMPPFYNVFLPVTSRAP